MTYKTQYAYMHNMNVSKSDDETIYDDRYQQTYWQLRHSCRRRY